MKPLTQDQKDEIKEIFEWGYFTKHLIKYKEDAGCHLLSEDDIYLLLEAETNLDMFSDFVSDSSPCDTCGSHGFVSVNIGNKTFVMKEW